MSVDYTQKIKKEKSAKPIRTVEEVNPEIEELTKKISDEDFGGMYTRLQVAKIAMEEKIPIAITDVRKEKVMACVLSSEEVGTLFLPF